MNTAGFYGDDTNVNLGNGLPMGPSLRQLMSLGSLTNRRDGRVVYCTGLENRRTERFRGFESRSLRHSLGMKRLHGVGCVIKAESEQNSEHTHPSLRGFPMCFGPKIVQTTVICD